MKVKSLLDLCFACPDGTIGVDVGFAKREFNCKTDRDRDFVYRHAGRLGYSVIVLQPNTGRLLVTAYA